MAEEITSNLQDMEETETQVQEEMDLVTGLPEEAIARESVADLLGTEENGGTKRGRDEEDDEDKGATKNSSLERSVEEERLGKVENEEVGGEERGGEEVKKTVEVEEISKEETDSAAGKVGPKMFVSSVEMFDYFHKLLHDWPTNLDINKYEHMVLIDLLKKGHADYVKKIGGGIQAFQVRYHPAWKSKCFFLLRTDGSVDDFSFRKCVDRILPLPENMKVSSASPNGKKAWGQQNGGGGGHGRGGRGGRGRGNRGR